MGRPSVIWEVSEAAEQYVVSERIADLAEPKTHRTFKPQREITEVNLILLDCIVPK